MRTRVLRLAVIVTGWIAFWASTAHAVTVSPTLVDVGGVLVGTSGTADFTIDGNGEHVNLVIASCDSGAGGTFSFSQDTGINLSSQRTITLTYDAALPRGIVTCQIRVERQSNGDLLATFSVRGTAQIPQQISVVDPSNFGSQRYKDNTVASWFSQRTVRVTNAGDRPLSITNVGINSSDYTFTGGTTQTLNPGQGHDWIVTFNPVGPATGVITAKMTFTSNDPGAGTKMITLTGTSTTATIATSPAALDFMTVAAGSEKALNATVSNNASTDQGPLGVKAGHIGNILPMGSPNWFVFSTCNTPDCTFSPAYQVTSSPRAIGIKCAPPASAAAITITGTVTFDNDGDTAAGNTLTVTCTGGASELYTDPKSLDFGPMLVGTSKKISLTLYNKGTQDADVSFTPSDATRVLVTGPSGCGTTAARCKVLQKANNIPQSITLDVTLTAKDEGPISASVDIIPTVGTGPSFTLTGRGIDRHLDVAGLDINGPLRFPETYRNPFDAPPTRPVPVTNTGEYPLHVKEITIDGDAKVWSLAKTFEMFDVPPKETVNVDVQFTPVGAGKAPPASIRIVTDATDDRLIAGMPGVGVVQLAGDGKDRNVDMVPGNIDIGETFAGIPARLSITRPGDVITVVNMDIQPFSVRDIAIEGGDASAFTLQDMNGDPFAATMIMPGEMKLYDVVFKAPYPGLFQSTVVLYLDQDPLAQKPVPIQATAQYVNAHGGGGCSTGGTGRLPVLVVLGGVLLRRRRRR